MNVIMKRLPKYYRKSIIMWAIAKAQAAMLEECGADAERFDRELYIATAVDNLSRWEADLQLDTPPMMDDYELWLNVRRANIIAKKTGYSACLKTLFEATAMAYTDERIELLIDGFWEKYLLHLKFYKVGRPSLLDQMKKALDEIRPANMKWDLLDGELPWQRRLWIDLLAACRTIEDRPEHTATEVTGVIKDPNTWNDTKAYTWRDVMSKEEILYESE